MALFLAAIKRRNEFEVMKESAQNHRDILRQYNKSTLDSIILITSIMILTTYSLYTMDSVTQDWRLVITVPIVVYVIFRQIHLASINQEQNISDNLLKDKGIVISFLVYTGVIIYLLYFSSSEFFTN